MIGYVLPTILMFIPWKDPNLVQNFEALWHFSPMFVPILCSLFGYLYVKRQNLVSVSREAKEPFPDVPHLQTLYIVTGALGLALHVYCVTIILTTPDIGLVSIFWPDFSPQPKALGEGLRALFMADFWGFEFATYVWLCMVVWDVKRMGRTTVGIGKACALIALGALIIGPGATMSTVWYCRESALAKTSFAHGLI